MTAGTDWWVRTFSNNFSLKCVNLLPFLICCPWTSSQVFRLFEIPIFLQQTVCCDPGFPSFDCILWHFATKIKTSNICCKCQHWPRPGQSLLFFVRFRVQRIAIKGRWSQIKKQCPIGFKIIDSSFSDFKWLIKYVCREEIECGQWGGLHIFCLNKRIDSWPEIWELRCQNTTRWGLRA